ncbi:hypothetical protein [Tepidibacter hydrothermalis]|uniref:Uncharacterized protein n=1 Tax=Tepidibacter hydrothermalis TaxID=3036126 RepID=A0ABY8EA18_9FIRM|nr:hypothetical protein [Tepidibacter hydrothermalis]WFD09755.1 hypothetical protein P4S50_15360 [Tepidibacter hydrothermalis]
MANKNKLKKKIFDKVDELIDAVEKIGDLNFFEMGIKNINGDLVIKLENTYKEKIK